jgi:hypothetical protein
MADHIVYSCVAYRYMTGLEGMTSGQIVSTAASAVSVTGATTLGADRVVVALSAGMLDSDDFVGSSSWASDDADVTSESFHIWHQSSTGAGGGFMSGAGNLAAAGPSGTWTSNWNGGATKQVNVSFALVGTQPVEVYDHTKGAGVDNVVVSEPIYGGGFYLVLYVVSDEAIETPAGWTQAFSNGIDGELWLTILTADADDSPVMPTLTYAGGGAPGPTNVDADFATLTLTAFDATKTVGAVSKSADLATLTLTAFDATFTPGPVNVAADLATLTLTAFDVTKTAGAVSKAADFATLTLTPFDSTATPGPVSREADLALLTLAAFDATPTPGPVSVDADLATLTLTAFDASVAGAAVQVSADHAEVLFTAYDAAATSLTSVTADHATITFTAYDATATPGPVTRTADLATLTFTAYDVTFGGVGGYIRPTANDQVLTFTPGVTVGTLFVRYHNVTVRGSTSNPEDTIWRLDDFSASAHSGIVCPFPPQTPDGQPVSKLTIENLTIDANELSTLVTCVGSSGTSCLDLVLNNVRIINCHRNSIAVSTGSGGLVRMTNVYVRTNGKVYTCSRARGIINGLEYYGGTAGLTIADSTLPVTSTVQADDITGTFDYWQGPWSETAVPTNFTATIMTLASAQNTANRSPYDVIVVLQPRGTATPSGSTIVLPGIQVFDRVEAADGVWAQVESVAADGQTATLGPWSKSNSWLEAAAPSGVCTVYSITLGRVWPGGWTTTTIQVANWHNLYGDIVTTPSAATPGILVRIRRHNYFGTTNRDVDTGHVHYTSPSVDSWVRNAWFRGGFSDQVTIRGQRDSLDDVHVSHGQDMGFTLTAFDADIHDISASWQGVHGVYVGALGRQRLSCVEANNNGVQRGNGIGYGIGVDPSIWTTPNTWSVNGVRGTGNRIALLNVTLPTVPPKQYNATITKRSAMYDVVVRRSRAKRIVIPRR